MKKRPRTSKTQSRARQRGKTQAPSPEVTPLEERHVALIRSLREEAFAVKDCFTRYSIQAVGFVVVALALIVRFQLESTYMSLTLLPVIVLLSAVGRMGTHKYAAASRLAGYELHLQRTARLSERTAYEWNQQWADLGWEEAMRAWRVVQATVFQRVYVGPKDYDGLAKTLPPKYWFEEFLPRQLYGRWKQDELHPDFRATIRNNQPLWFEPQSLFGATEAEYYPGGYLGTMINVIHASMGICVFFLGLSPVLTYLQTESIGTAALKISGLLLLFLVTTVVLSVHSKQLYQRQKVIENGLLSIHSCAILWHAIVIAHFRALRDVEAGRDGVRHYDGYTNALAKHAADLAENILEIHEWMRPGRGGLQTNEALGHTG